MFPATAGRRPYDRRGGDRRLIAGITVSVLLHGLLLSLQFGVPGLDLGGGGPITITLAPDAVPATAPSVLPETPPAAPPVLPPVPAATTPSPRTMRLVDPAPPAPQAKVETPAPAQARAPRRARTAAPRRRLREVATPVIVAAADPQSEFEMAVPLPDIVPEPVSEPATPAEALASELPAETAETEVVDAGPDLAAQEEAERIAAEQERQRQLALAQEQEQERAVLAQAEQDARIARQRDAEQLQAREQAARDQAQLLRDRELQEAALARRRAEEEALRLAHEQAERQRLAQEAAARQQVEELAQRRLAEEAAQKQAQKQAQEQVQRQAQQQAQQQAAEQARAEAERLARQADEAARQAAARQAQGPAAGTSMPVGGAGTGRGAGIGAGSVPGPGAQAGLPGNRARELLRGVTIPDASAPVMPSERAMGGRRVLADGAERDAPLRLYVDSVRQKLERNAVIGGARLALQDVRIDPLVSLSLRSDGSIDEVTIIRSSGRAEIDDAVRRFVRLNARYSAFPPNVAAHYDIIEIRRIWRFSDGLKLIEEMR